MNKYSGKMNLTKNMLKITEFLLRNIDKPGFNINQIARNTSISVGSAHEILHDLKKRDIAKTIDFKTSIYYKLNLNNSDTIDICKLISRESKRKLSSIAKVYSEEIEKFDKAQIIIMFGSILVKKEFNDVDVLFITNKVKEVNIFCNEISKIRTKPINPLIMTFNDFINNIKIKHKVILDIINKGVIIKGEDKFMEALINAKF